MNKYILKKTLLASIVAFFLANPEKIYAEENIMEKYLEEQLNFYKEHPEALEEDAEIGEIVIDSRGETYKKLVANSIKNMENEFADIACIDVTSIGNASSTGDGNPTKNLDPLGNGMGYKLVAIVGVKAGSKYPFAIAEYDKETNTIGNIIGWFKDEDVYAYCNEYSEVIEMPISKYITYGNIFDFDVDSNGNMINHSYTLPYNYTAIEENHRHGIRIGYTQQEKEGYYSTCDGLYVSKDRETYKATLDSKNLELVLKFNIKNK